MEKPLLVFTTFPDTRSARKACSLLVKKKLAACGQIVPIESVYRWKGRVEQAAETLCLFKTEKRLFPAIEQEIKAIHPYDVPEIAAVALSSISRPYLAWLRESVRGKHRLPRS